MNVVRGSSWQVSIGPVSRDPGSPKALFQHVVVNSIQLLHPGPVCAGADRDPPFGSVALLESDKGRAILARCRCHESLAFMRVGAFAVGLGLDWL